MAKNKVIMRQLANMQNLHIQQHLITCLVKENTAFTRRFDDCLLGRIRKRRISENFLSWMNPQVDNQEEMKKVFGNLQRGIRVDVEDIQLNMEQKFYILCLAPNAARLSVRFFIKIHLDNIMENLSKHYQRMEIVKPAWVELDYLGIRNNVI
ncbi:MAG: type I-C CRISPR-associated protein Cas8c/Csd1 [Ruminococcus sp.]